MKKNFAPFRRLFPALLVALSMSGLMSCSSTPPVAAQEPLRLYAFNCGRIDTSDVSVFHPGIGKGEHKTLADSCYLIVHPKGTLMWDTGFSDALAAKPEGLTTMGIFVAHLDNTLTEQFKEIGRTPDSVTYLGISHMHFDHVGNTPLFPHARLLIQKEEYDAAFGKEPAKFGFDPATYPTLGANPVTKLEGDHDVFGDGSVVIKRTLGHTPGHQALYVKLAKTGNVLLSGDLVHLSENWEHKYVPGFNFDKEQSVKTMTDVEQFLKANKAQLWIQHDEAQSAGIKHAPAFYE